MSFDQGYTAGYEVGGAVAKALKIALYIRTPFVVYKFKRRRKLGSLKKPEA